MNAMFRHPLTGALMALLLVLTGQSLAAARGAPGPAGEIVLCTGAGPVTVLVDENGQPVGHAHICPDCTMQLLAAVAGQAGAPLVLDARPLGLAIAVVVADDLAPLVPFWPRGPPRPV